MFRKKFDRVSSQEIWQIMHNSQLLTVRLFFDSEWANVTGLHISKKSYKKDRNLKRVESKDRVKNILHAANNKSDFDMVSLIQSVDKLL
jgi:hypothetical protein